ncbi:glycosyltransferase family 4 protein [Roseomonas sp. SSH11]|uniref:Glycosyltransferase family 4 protein n=1 Tax=Pararoseomonas baculiformis TaxID=2820812 RepID=A0ABS4AL42_9PROT|nr:glycosyltransferase [Pararoseomonas baculiformis]MBP0447235.1 glycosyltransferase family 4 protein [Pararoseomonas baculiformis]
MGPSSGGYDRHWITRFVSAERHRFADVLGQYEHDRSRRVTSPRQWLDYFRHAFRGIRVARLTRDPGIGILTVFPQLGLAAGLLKRLLGLRAPVVAWSFNVGQDFSGWKARLAHAGLVGVNRMIVHSRREIETYAATFGLPRERFVFVPFSVNVLHPQHAEEEERPFLLSMGSANRDYGCLFDAVRTLDIPVVVVAGPHATAGLDVPPNVELRHGLSLEACHVLAQQARLNVVPILNSFSASGQVTVIEAMMFARCVIASHSIGTEDYVADGENGILVPSADPAALRAAILAAWGDAPLRQRIGKAARRHALEHLTHEAAARTMERICDEAARTT